MKANSLLLVRINLKKKKGEPFFSDFIEGIHLVGLEDLCGSHAELILSYIFFVKPFLPRITPPMNFAGTCQY